MKRVYTLEESRYKILSMGYKLVQAKSKTKKYLRSLLKQKANSRSK